MAQREDRSYASWLDRPVHPKVGRKSRQTIDNEILDRARGRFDRIQATMRESRIQCLQDRRFYSVAGAQWEGPLQDQFANRPRFEANLIQLAIIKIFNEYRNNRIAVDFIPKDGSPDRRLADTLNGLYRADEIDSVSEEAHDNAFDEGVGGGFGAWRLVATYEDDENPDKEKQRIRIEPIFDADSSVFFDLDAKRQDKADAKYCYVLYSMTTQAYIDTWDDDPVTWPKIVRQYEFDWATPSVVFVCEYYEVEIKKEEVFIYETLDGEKEEYTQDQFKRDTALRERLEAIGSREIESKKRTTRKVHKYIMSGGKILEDCGYIAGKCIPIVPYYGKRWFVDNVERCSGVTRIPKDMQRLLNMQLSKLGEIAAIGSVEKPIFTPEQIQGLTEMYANDNLQNFPYLLVNPITGPDGTKTAAGPVGYTKSPSIPPATAALIEITMQLIRELLGSQQNAEQITSNISGRAVELIQNKIDMQSYIYLSNMGKAVKREGEIYMSMAKDLMIVKGRKMKTVNGQGKVGQIELMRPVVTKKGVEVENDLTQANFDVTVTVGPSSLSKKSATVRALTGLLALTDNPEDRQVLTGMALTNMEGEGLSDVNEYYRKKMVRMGVVTPTDEEKIKVAEELQNRKPSPEDEFLKAEAGKAEALGKKANADTLNVLADADLKVAKTAEAYAGIDIKERQQGIDAAQVFANTRVENARASEDQP